MDDYQKLACSLNALGIESYLQNPEMLVVSGRNPTLPSSNSFWVTKKGEDWFIGTWLPAIYRAEDGEQICDICDAVFKSSPTAIYKVDPSLAVKLKLHRLTDSEVENF